jgi:transcriptional regulator NrdR family protein
MAECKLNLTCPVCHGGTRVIDSRGSTRAQYIRRRRACNICGHRFTTIETAALTNGNGRADTATPEILEQVKVLRRTLNVLEAAGHFTPDQRKRAEGMAKQIRRRDA